MVTDEMLALARRVVACLGWRWLRGCPWERLPTGAPDDGGDYGAIEGTWAPPAGALPDLQWPAAEGCLLACVSRALSAPWAHLVPFPTHVCDDADGLKPATWWAVSLTEDNEPVAVKVAYGRRYLAGPTKAHALVEALEYAARKEDDRE